MSDARIRFVPSDDGTVLDRDTGLVWEQQPSSRAIPWEVAARRHDGTPWRLPTASELLVLLNGLHADHPFTAPAADALFWSATVSPFSARGEVRAVGCRDGPLWIVRLLERDARARAWHVLGGL